MEHKLTPYNEVSKIEGCKVVVLAPHPDDEVFGCCGAIMRHVAAGDTLQVIILSDGEYRADEAHQLAYGRTRRAESNAAALMMGCGTPQFWALPDRGIEYCERLVLRIEEAITAVDADLVYAPSLYEMHPDHRALGMAAVEAVRRHATSPKLAMYEVGVPMMRPNVLLDISDLVDRKQRAMECFATQLDEQPYDQHIAALNRFRTYTLGKHVTAAEAYFVVPAATLSTNVLDIYTSEYERQRSIGLPMLPADVPLVSVLIRSAGRHTLRASLDSVALQTYSNIEVIVVNTKEGEHDVIGNFCGRFPMRAVVNSISFRRSYSSNLAMHSAKGDYLIFLDDNACFRPHHVSTLVERICSQPLTKVVYCRTQVADETAGSDEHTADTVPDTIHLMTGSLAPIHGILFDRGLMSIGCSFDESLYSDEDWDFQLQLAQQTQFSRIDRVGAYYLTEERFRQDFHPMHASSQKGREAIFEKWKSIWSGNQISALVTYKDSLVDTSNQLQHETLNALVKKTEMQLKDTQKQLFDEISTNESLKFKLAELESKSIGEIGEIHASTSWRLTAPLRMIGRKLLQVKHIFKGVHR